jgi:hypothetical protein
MQLVSTVTVGAGGASSIEFTSIPQTGTDLLCQISVRGADSAAVRGVRRQFNSDTGTNYAYINLSGDGGTASSGSAGGATFEIPLHFAPAGTSTSNTFGNAQMYVANYTSSSAKSVSGDGVGENNATTAYQHITAGRWTGTAGITSVKIYLSQGNMVQHSTASLYTITKA